MDQACCNNDRLATPRKALNIQSKNLAQKAASFLSPPPVHLNYKS